jgi:hypothetical protein
MPFTVATTASTGTDVTGSGGCLVGTSSGTR